jgi:hypothetical protein
MEKHEYDETWQSFITLKEAVTKLLDARELTHEWELLDHERTADDTIEQFFLKHRKEIATFDDGQIRDLLSVFQLRYGYFEASRLTLRRDHLSAASKEIPSEVTAQSVQGIADQVEALVAKVRGIKDRLARYWTKDGDVTEDVHDYQGELFDLNKLVEEVAETMADYRGLVALLERFGLVKEEWLTVYNEVQWLLHVATKKPS